MSTWTNAHVTLAHYVVMWEWKYEYCNYVAMGIQHSAYDLEQCSKSAVDSGPCFFSLWDDHLSSHRIDLIYFYVFHK